MKKLICLLLGHQYAKVIDFTPWSRMIACKRCRSRWGMNDDAMALIPWCAELEAFHASMGHFNQKEAANNGK
jgi:hypothetical protein